MSAVMQHWVTFAERFPPANGDGELLCSFAGGKAFAYHWRTDFDGHTERKGFMWLEGFRIPRVPQPHEVECCCQRRKAA